MQRFGIEIEAYGLFKGQPVDSTNLDPAQETIVLDASGIGREYWRAVPDRSLIPDDQTLGFEIVSKPMTWREGVPETMRAIGALKRAGAKVNGSCGLHVHVEMPESQVQAATMMENAYEAYRYFEDTFDQMVHPRRRADVNRYCKGLADVPFRAVKDRYHKVNPFSYVHHGTLEFRHHHATLDPDQVARWLQTLKRFIEGVSRRSAREIRDSYAPDQAGLNAFISNGGIDV